MSAKENEKRDTNSKVIALRVQEAKKRDIGRNIARIDQEAMEELDIKTGDVIALIGKKESAGIAWPSYPQDSGLGIIRIDSRLKKNTGTSIDETIQIRKVTALTAQNIVLAPISVKIKSNPRFETFVKRKLHNYPVTIDDFIYISIGISREITFKVNNIRPGGVCIIKPETALHISEHITEDEERGADYVTYEDVGGLDREIQRVREMVELPLRHPSLFKRLGIDPPKGVLLRGPPGCGKTLLARAVANESEAFFISINGPEIMSKFYGESEKKLRNIFIDAEEKSPSIIFIDEIDAIAPKRETVTGEVERRVVAQLLALMDGLHSRGRVIVIGATNRPNSLDPALRRPGRFDREIEIKVPNEKGRREIFQIHTRNMPLEKISLKEFANITHGFVGADISAVCREAAMSALRRYLPQIDLESEIIDPELLEQIKVTKDDFEEALKEVMPSGIREVFVEVPNVTWDQIGGLEDLKQKLIESVDWPLSHPNIFERMGITPPRGILLYGPPGCGKTLLARAVAHESKANFISIKGPELLSKYVGESEKAIREVFRKAKMAAPCIIFFDEFDSIAPSRGRYTTDSGVSEKVLSQFLTELDGLEVKKDIIVIAATNRPDILDPALIRPGRIDRILLVPAPDDAGREKILQIFTKDMPLTSSVDILSLNKKLDGYSGADIETLCREAGMIALRENMKARKISRDHFKLAMESINPSINQKMIKFYESFGKKLKNVIISQTKEDRMVI
ncbi:MAG: AAA family ATPase [Candidatus Lokiarchaeota archaeon]|nr:AAA family ATPase [Candidatus Lokiarchaeota archaeon]